MATLTDYLNGPGAGKGIVNPGPADPGGGGGFLGDLANLASTGVRGYSQHIQNKRQEEEYQRDQRVRSALNDAEGAFFSQQLAAERTLEGGTTRPGGYVPIDAELPGDVVKAGRDYRKASKATEQGRLSQSALDIHGERIVNELYQKYPEMKREIATYLQGRGLNHYMFRELTEAQELEDADRKTQIAGAQAYYNQAIQSGLIPPGTSLEEGAVVGQRFAESQARLAVLEKQAQAAKAAAAEGRADHAAGKPQRDAEAAGAVIEHINSIASPILQRLYSLTPAINTNDPASIIKLQNMAPGFQASMAQARMLISGQVARLGLGEDAMRTVNTYMDDLEKGVNGVFSGPLSVVETRTKILQTMKQQWGLDDAKAFPLYSRLSNLFGQGNVDALFAGENPLQHLPPEVAKAVQAELTGYKQAGETAGATHIANLSLLLRGEKGLEDLSEQEAIQQVPNLIKNTRNLGKMILNGEDTSTQSVTSWSNSYSGLLQAGMAMQPGTKDITSVQTALQVITGPESRRMIEKVMATDPERGEALMFASRSTAAKLLEVARQAGPSENKSKFQRLQYDPEKRKYTIFVDRKAYDKWASSQQSVGSEFFPAGSVPTLSFEAFMKPSPELDKKAQALNAAIEHLTSTAKYDKELPQGATPKSLAQAYATGDISRLVDAKGKPIIDPKDGLNQQLDSLAKDIREFPARLSSGATQPQSGNNPVGRSNYEGFTRNSARKYGVPEEVLISLIEQESGWNPNAKNSRSSATGIAQFITETAQTFGIDPTDPYQSIDAAGKYLKQLIDKNDGDVLKALEDYGVIHPSNFSKGRDDPQYQRLVARFQELLG